jgi:hypothetical protein
MKKIAGLLLTGLLTVLAGCGGTVSDPGMVTENAANEVKSLVIAVKPAKRT